MSEQQRAGGASPVVGQGGGGGGAPVPSASTATSAGPGPTGATLPAPRPRFVTGNPSVDFTPEVRVAISEILTSSDPLDASDFNPIEYINDLLPNEQALSNIDNDISRLKMKIRLLDEDIFKQIRLQAKAGTQGKQDLGDAQSAITELFAKINDIKLKAEQSELMVQEICRDIKKLDYAKRHLTSTITALKRTHMLVTAVDQLKAMTEGDQFLHAGNLLEAVNQLSSFFVNYSHIPKIKELQDTAASVRERLRQKANDAFDSVLSRRGAPIPNATQLSEVCFVFDALGTRVRMDFMQRFTQSQLKDYKSNFPSHAENSRLDFIDRRFMWIKKELKFYDEQFMKIFPVAWRLDEFLVDEFCNTTKEMLIELLEKSHKTLEVVALVQALQKTNDFEREMSLRFSAPQYAPPPSAEDSTTSTTPQRTKSPSLQKFKGSITSAFDKYMSIYINQEDKLMGEKFEKSLREETWLVPEDEGTNKVLTSSTDIVYYFKQTMKRSSALTKGQPLFEIFKLFKKYFMKYAAALQDRMPKYNPNEPVVQLRDKDEKTICLIINTADYCGNMTTQLADSIKKTINETFVDLVNMNDEQEAFTSVSAKATNVLVYGLETKLDSALNNMAKMSWANWDSVGDQSEYMTQICSTIMQTVPLYNRWLSNIHFKFFSDSFVRDFTDRLVATIHRCRRISATGAEQILLDMSACHDVLKEMPAMGLQEGAVPPRHAKFVKSQMSKVEMLLKVLITPQAGLVHSYKTLFPEGTETNFIKIMDLKGLKRNEQAQLIENLRNYELQMKAEKKALSGAAK